MNLSLFILSSAYLFIYTWARTVQYFVNEDAPRHFQLFMKKFNKKYVNDHEKATRYKIFKNNLMIINRSNNASSHAVFGVNRFTDMTHEEFLKTSTGLLNYRDMRTKHRCKNIKHIPRCRTPKELDWRTLNVVSRVKDQLKCGCCYAFSVTGMIEAQFARKYGILLDLSEQQLLDCDKLSHGCKGGLTTFSLSELIRLGGSMLTNFYPYTGFKGSCKSSKKSAVVKIKSCQRYMVEKPDKVKNLLVSIGPLAVSIKADVLKEYKNGIVDDLVCSPDEVNHSVLLVGYGTENNKSYWIFKNSWGFDYGENGYFRLERSRHKNGSLGLMNYIVSAKVHAINRFK